MKLVMSTITPATLIPANAGIQWARNSHSDLSVKLSLDSPLRGNDSVWQGQSARC
jgi:hypothetical protein